MLRWVTAAHYCWQKFDLVREKEANTGVNQLSESVLSALSWWGGQKMNKELHLVGINCKKNPPRNPNKSV